MMAMLNAGCTYVGAWVVPGAMALLLVNEPGTRSTRALVGYVDDVVIKYRRKGRKR